MSEGGLLVMGSAGESVPGLPPAAGIVAAPWLVAASLQSLIFLLISHCHFLKPRLLMVLKVFVYESL